MNRLFFVQTNNSATAEETPAPEAPAEAPPAEEKAPTPDAGPTEEQSEEPAQQTGISAFMIPHWVMSFTLNLIYSDKKKSVNFS